MSSQIRNFIIAFVVAAVIFSGIAVVAVDIIDTKILNPGKGDGEENGIVTAPAPPEDTAVLTEDDVYHGTGTTFNFLLIGTEVEQPVIPPQTDAILKPEAKNRAVTLIFAMFNKEKNEFVVSPIPSETLINVDGVKMNIGDAFNYKDAKYIADKVSVLLGLAVDYYMSVDLAEFGAFVEYMNGVECNVPTDVSYFDDIQGVNIDLEQGNQVLSGSDVVGLLHYKGYENHMQKINFEIDVFMNIMNRITSNYLNKQQFATLYAFFTQNMKTNFTFDVMKGNLELIFKFTTMKKSFIIYPGYWTDEGFNPEKDKGNETFSVYR